MNPIDDDVDKTSSYNFNAYLSANIKNSSNHCIVPERFNRNNHLNSSSVRKVYRPDISVDRYGFIRQDRSTVSNSQISISSDYRYGSHSQRLPVNAVFDDERISVHSTLSELKQGSSIPAISQICTDNIDCHLPECIKGRSPSGNSSHTVKTDDQSDLEDDAFADVTEIVDVLTLQRHELKWLDMFRNWPMWMSRHFVRLKGRCKKGIPMSVRGRAWRYLSGAVVLENQQPNLFSELSSSENANPRILAEITKDLHRSFPNHELFYSSDEQIQYDNPENSEGFTLICNGSCLRDFDRHDEDAHSKSSDKHNYEDSCSSRCTCTISRPRGQSDLYSVLKAYSLYNSKVGYCQALAPIASVLLMHLPANQAFWVLVCICRFYMHDYYGPGLDEFRKDGEILKGILTKSNYQYSEVLADTEPILYMTEWFMCLYSRSLPWASVLRVWDMFFCEGPKILFKVALAWLNIALERYKDIKLDKSQGTSLVDLVSRSDSYKSDTLDTRSIDFSNHRYSKRSTLKLTPRYSVYNRQTDIMNRMDEQGELLKVIKHTPRIALSPNNLIKKVARIRLSDRQLIEVSRQL